MKYYCEACERLVPPAAFRLEDGLLVIKCSRCKVEMRCGPDQDGESASAPASKSSGGPVIMLAQEEAEADPIENEPTRRIAVPASLLAAIEEETQQARRKKSKEAKASKDTKAPKEFTGAKTPAPEPAMSKPPPPVPEPVVTKSPAPEPVKTAAPRLAMSEAAAASNLLVMRLSDVQSKGAGESAPTPSAPAPVPARALNTQLRVVTDSAPPASAAPVSPPSSEDPFMPPPGYCPKCIGARREGAGVCPFCGLEYARFRPDEFRPSPVLASTWLGVLELWESKGAHDKVLALASEKGELALLGRLYRIRLARQPEDAMAKRGREEVLRLASAGSAFIPTPPPDKRAKMRTAALGVVFFMLVVAAVLIAYQARRMLMADAGP